MDRFWNKVDTKTTPDGCHPWTGARNQQGYGLFMATLYPRKKCIGSHRQAYILTHGPIPPETPIIMHTCDNPSCCNPAHLVAGTYKDNSADCTTKGRRPTRRTPSTRVYKLTDADVRCIRHLCDNKYHHMAIAVGFRISQSYVRALHLRTAKALVPTDGPVSPIPEICDRYK